MAKIASSKPYGSGKTKTPTKSPVANKEIETTSSPVRTSPRRRKSLVEAEEEAVQWKEAKKGKKVKPAPPKFTESKKKKGEGSEKTRGRRKSALEPIVVNEPEAKEFEEVNVEVRDEIRDEFDEIFEYVNYKEEQEAQEEEQEEEYRYQEQEQEEEDYVESIHRTESIYEEKQISQNNEINQSAIYEEEAAFHYDEDEVVESEGSNSEALDEEEYNDQFQYNSSNVRLRLAQYFQRQEMTTMGTTASSLKNQLWTRMKEWVSERVIPATVEYTKKAIEQISKSFEKPAIRDIEEFEPEIYEISDDQDEIDYEMEVESKKVKLSEEIENLEEENYSPSLPHIPLSHSDSASCLTPQTKSEPKIVYNEVMDSRLTEIVLFFAKCSWDTPIFSIYEHLEEFFTLKGENGLNFTEKQLVSTVIKEFLTEAQEEEQFQTKVPPVYEPVSIVPSSKVLPRSGIRFRAPKFSPEEEARLEELEQIRQKNLSTKISTLSTPQQRTKIQRKLLAPERTVEIIEGLPENRGRAGNFKDKSKSDSVSSAIEDIISQKVL